MKLAITLASLLLASTASMAQWKYEVEPDKMTSGNTHFAMVRSVNRHQFQFPYHGGASSFLILRSSPDGKLRVYMVAEKGQLLCHQDCSVRVRFDDQEPDSFRAWPPADHSSDVIFIGDEENFVGRALVAKRIRIEATFFREGARIFEFKTTGLKWPPVSAASK